MDVKKILNAVGVIAIIIAIVFQFLSAFKWLMLLISFILILIGGCLISKANARKYLGIISLISEAFSIMWSLWMLIDFARFGTGPIYYPVLCLVFDLLATTVSSFMLIMWLEQNKGKEYNPLINYLNAKENQL